MTAPTVHAALNAVMGDVQAVKKGDRNAQQGFNFRGIDAVVNAVGPALRKHGVIAVPHEIVAVDHESYDTRNGAKMRNTTVRIRWRFYGPAGDHVEAESVGEASDAGDKSVSKAHSVAYRTVLLQALCIPTDEPDPDHATYERATTSPPDPRAALWRDIKQAREALGWSSDDASQDFASWSQGASLLTADADALTRYVHYLRAQKKAS